MLCQVRRSAEDGDTRQIQEASFLKLGMAQSLGSALGLGPGLAVQRQWAWGLVRVHFYAVEPVLGHSYWVRLGAEHRLAWGLARVRVCASKLVRVRGLLLQQHSTAGLVLDQRLAWGLVWGHCRALEPAREYGSVLGVEVHSAGAPEPGPNQFCALGLERVRGLGLEQHWQSAGGWVPERH